MYEDVYKQLDMCIRKKSLNYSSVREVVLKEILESNEALCSEEVHKRVNKRVQKKVSYNTVYRVLRLFEECGIVLTVQSDIKKTHFCLALIGCKAYMLDLSNNKVTPIKNSKEASSLLREQGLENSDSFVVIHKK